MDFLTKYFAGHQVLDLPFCNCLLTVHTVFFCITGHRHTGQCRRHWNSGIHRLNPVPEHSGTGLYFFVPGPDMPNSLAFRHYNNFFAKEGISVSVQSSLEGAANFNRV
jgi:hypothetical protein